MKKAMVIGINPEYRYPGAFDDWRANNTLFASNYGGSLITRSVQKEFSADYIEDFSDIGSLNKKYSVCFVAFATHVHSTRDISLYADVVEKLEMKVVALSLGVQDYLGAVEDDVSLSPSVIRFLKAVSKKSNMIGVRGPYTAAILERNGFGNVFPIGCPTVFSNLHSRFEISKPDSFKHPLVVYHRSVAKDSRRFMGSIDLLGQDFQDEAVFTENLCNDTKLQTMEKKIYESLDNYEEIYKNINDRGIFPGSFDDWLAEIKSHDFIIGPRLHGNIAAILNGIPQLLFVRDLRMKEMVEMFDFPSIEIEKAQNYSVEELYNLVDYSEFQRTYETRYHNFIHFLKVNEVEHNLEHVETKGFILLDKDILSKNRILQSQINSIANVVPHAYYSKKLKNKLRTLKRTLSRVFG